MSVQVYLLAPNTGQMEFLQKLAPDETEIVWVDSSKSIEEQAEGLKDAVSVIVTPSAFSVELAQLCTNLRLIQTVSAGTNMIDKTALGELGIKVANNGGGNSTAVAEHTIGLMISTYRKFQLQFDAVRAGEWAGNIRSEHFEQAFELTDKTVGIVGLGRIGSKVARRLQGWDCNIIYSDVVSYPELEEELGLTQVPLDELLRTSDVITLHVPLDRTTEKFISDREFDMMKPNVVFVNACRGPVVDEAALIRALIDKKIMGAGLDVLEEEPTDPNNPLLHMDNVLVTPHLAAFAQESTEKSRAFAITNTANVARGAEPDSVVLPV